MTTPDNNFLSLFSLYPPKLFDISYDLNVWGQNYPGVIAEIERMGGVRVQMSKWWVMSHRSAAALRDHLLPLIDFNDSLMVAELTGDVAGYENRPDLRAWMNAALERRAA
jgi:hypothetical protein